MPSRRTFVTLVVVLLILFLYFSVYRAPGPRMTLQEDHSEKTPWETIIAKQRKTIRRKLIHQTSAFGFSASDKKVVVATVTAALNIVTTRLLSSAKEWWRLQRLDDLLMEEGGTPRRSLLVTTWRSGSTFVADILNSHPAVFYHYEPLMLFDIQRARSEGQVAEAHRILQNLANCDYSQLGEYIGYAQTHLYVFLHNHRLWRHCDGGRNATCWRPEFLSALCRQFPFQTTKTVRLPLAAAQELMDAQADLKVLLLVRDPRGTMESRRHREFCKYGKDCSDPAALCNDLEQDYWTAWGLNKAYTSQRLRVLRYEDISLDLEQSLPRLLQHMGLQMHPAVRRFILRHTRSQGIKMSTQRNSRVTPFLWASSMTWERISYVQKHCQRAMQLWGYNQMTKTDWAKLNQNRSPENFTSIFKFRNTLNLDYVL